MDLDYRAGYLAGYDGRENLAHDTDSPYAIGYRDGWVDGSRGVKPVVAA